MNKRNILNLDKITKKELFDELNKGIEDIEVGNVISIKEAESAIKERHAAYLRDYSVKARTTRSS